nr:ATP-binding cassette domain-containing protein [Desulfurococcales archaeon]
MSGHAIQIDDIWVKYPGRSGHVLKGISLSVERGEVLGLLGPSGSGKSTLLKAIAGIIPIEKGKIFIEGRDVTDLPPNKRKLGVVFQSFALFPHMKVWENVAYGLKVRRASKEKILGKVKELLELVGLSGMEDRYPSQLSGGQQQRVALARALAIDPRV